jgi:hypothetical protein
VISSRSSPLLAARSGWMLLYPRHENEAVVDVSGQSLVLAEPDLQLVLAFLSMVAAKG